MTDANYQRKDLDTMLYLLFNSGTQIINKTPLSLLLSKNIQVNDISLSKPELIAETAFLKKKLQNNVNSTDFQVLQMFYQSTNDVESSLIRYEKLIIEVIKEAKILVNHCNSQFAILCCLSFSWNKNLFTKKTFGPYSRWYPKTSFYRKRSMLNTALEKMRKRAMISAEKAFSL